VYQTYDQYLLSQRYIVYFTFGEAFSKREAALEYSMQELARQGSLVEVMCLTVPDAACQNCGEMLFDWQSSVGDGIGTKGSDSCYYSASFGLVCEGCALHEAKLEVSEEILPAKDIAECDEMFHII